MASIKNRITSLELSRRQAPERSFTDMERAVRVTHMIRNPEQLPAAARLQEIIDKARQK